jgi:hypothetical protein
MRTKRNQLTNDKMYKVARWVETNNQYLSEKRLSYTDAAKVAGDALGFEVTEYNIKAAAGTAGVEWRGRIGGSGKRPPGSKDRARIVARELMRLMNTMGEEVSDDLYRVVYGRDRNKTDE